MQKRYLSEGASLIDLLISMAIIAALFGGIYLVYFSLVTAIANISVRTAATTAINAEIETIRNLPYDSVGTVGGVPAGVIPQSQVVQVGKYSFTLQTTMRNIDDPFDGTLSGNPPPVDTAPADYKLVTIRATCALCSNFGSISITTTVAPKNLESATQNGSLFVSAINASGISVPAAAVRVINTSVSPTIDLTDTTNASGVLQLVGVPTSTQGYQITVTKAGYSTEQTYPPGAPGNPNPTKPNATVVAQTLTGISFAIDNVSTLTVSASDNRCAPISNESFSLAGSKLIGTPNVLKFSTTSATTASGSVMFANLEWDTYAFSLNDATQNLAGTIPLSPFIVNPSSTVNFRFVVQPAANPSLLVAVVDAATGAGIQNALITASQGSFSQTLTTGHAIVTQTDWSGGQYTSRSGGIDATSTPGSIVLLRNASGTYPTSTNDWFISTTIDLGGASTTWYSISWNPTAQPPQTGAGSLKFQVATNNDNATWNFVGPDGAAGTYFTVSSTSLPLSFSGNRYLRYKGYLNTQDTNYTPRLDDISFEFYANCVPPAQALFTGLPQASYTINASAQNYSAGSTTVVIGPGAQSSTISLVHL